MKSLSLLFLAVAISALHLGATAQQPTRKVQTVTYADHIAPILGEKCISCHRSGGMGPFSLTTYEEVRKRHALVREVIMKRQMPPTDAHSDYARLVTDPPLTDEEIIL